MIAVSRSVGKEVSQVEVIKVPANVAYRYTYNQMGEHNRNMFDMPLLHLSYFNSNAVS